MKKALTAQQAKINAASVQLVTHVSREFTHQRFVVQVLMQRQDQVHVVRVHLVTTVLKVPKHRLCALVGPFLLGDKMNVLNALQVSIAL